MGFASPCEDSLFLALKAKPLDAMSEREFAYFQAKAAECAEYQKLAMTTDPAQQALRTTDKWISAWLFVSFVGILASLAIWATTLN